MKYTCIALLVAVLTIPFAGCGGGGSKSSTTSTVETRTTTTGQELMDLQKAFNAGVITEREYNAQKKKILDNN